MTCSQGVISRSVCVHDRGTAGPLAQKRKKERETNKQTKQNQNKTKKKQTENKQKNGYQQFMD